jgi:hypothetical protein
MSFISEDSLADMFDEQVEEFCQCLENLRRSWSEDQAEESLQHLYIAISIEDSKLSQEGRAELKSALVKEGGAMKIILDAMKRRYSSPKFYRRACGCLAYLIRGCPESASMLKDLGGIDFIIEVMQAFDTNEIIQWYCFDLLGVLASNCSTHDEIVLENLVGNIVKTMVDLHRNAPHLYDKTCQALILLVAKKSEIRTAIARKVAGISRGIIQSSYKSNSVPPVQGDVLSPHFGQLMVCHDILSVVLLNEL